MASDDPTVYPSVTPDWSGTRYCVPCAWRGRHPNRTDDRVYIVRFSDKSMDFFAYCHAHATDEGYIEKEEQR